jgi:hypothetical protein
VSPASGADAAAVGASGIVVPDPLSQASKAAKKAREDARINRERVAQADQQRNQVDSVRRENERLQRENQAAREYQQRLKADPYKALKDLGMTEEDLARRSIMEGSPEQRMAQLQAQLDQEKGDRKALEDRLTGEKNAQIRAQAQKDLVSAAADETKYPHLSQQPPDVIVHMAYNTLAKITSTIDPGTGLPIDASKMSYDDVCYVLETLYETHSSSRSKSAASKAKELIDSAKDPAAIDKKPSTKTLTNKLSGQKTKIIEVDHSKLSDRESRKILADQLRAQGVAK